MQSLKFKGVFIGSETYPPRGRRGTSAPRANGRDSYKIEKPQIVSYGNRWYEETRKASVSGRTAREEIGMDWFDRSGHTLEPLIIIKCN